MSLVHHCDCRCLVAIVALAAVYGFSPIQAECGCGVDDTDSDGDSVPDCIDQCPDTCGLMILVDEVGCPLALGSCCNGPACTPFMDQASCTGTGGVYLGDGSWCDSDGDGQPDCAGMDDCVEVDGDGFGNPGYPGNICPDDNCPCVPNPDQLDTDADGVGDVCDRCPGFDDHAERDGDGVPDGCDNCPNDANRDQADADGDGTGDACDLDADGDGVSDDIDNCVDVPNADQTDSDCDGAGDACDHCPNDPGKTEPGQCGCGVADTDADGDWVMDCADACPDTPGDVLFVDPDGCPAALGGCCLEDMCSAYGPMDEPTCTAQGGLYLGDNRFCDADGDGLEDCPFGPPTGDDCVDFDGDGYGDPGYVYNTCPDDSCPGTVPGSPVDGYGCPPLIPGDFNRDGDVDMDDFGLFQSCASGPGIPLTAGCENRDLDGEGDVDASDFGIFQRCYSGQDQPADPACAGP